MNTYRDALPAWSAVHLVPETNPMPVGLHSIDREDIGLVEFARLGGRVTRLRLLTENMGMGVRVADVSYCYGVLPDGREVSIQDLWFSMIPMRQVKKEIIDICREKGVFAKALGLLDDNNWSVLY